VGGEGSIDSLLLPWLIEEFKRVLETSENPVFPPCFESDPVCQLRNGIRAIWNSWMHPIAMQARVSRTRKVPDEMGTAVVVQKMVFGNRDERDCLSGVFFTRNQRTGSNFPVIEWAPKVQCDKIVSGKLRKPLLGARQLKEKFPAIFDRLLLVKERVERRARRPLDIEFTVEDGKLYILQRRPLRMTFNATVRSLWDLVDEGKTSIQMASMVINNALNQPEKVLKEGFHDYKVLASGEPITNSAECGILVLGSQAALELAAEGVDVVLLRKRPYGETDVAINNPRVRAVIRCDGNTTGHEAVSAVAYSKPYIIHAVDAEGRPLIATSGEEIILNPESSISAYEWKRVFVDGERGILGYTEASDFLEDRKSRKKLYLDWEHLEEQFVAKNYRRLDYEELLDIHYDWELELELYRRMEKNFREGEGGFSGEELLDAFARYVSHLPPKDLKRTLELKEVCVEDFDFGPPLAYHGGDLAREVSKVLRPLMLFTTWRTHWIHEIMVQVARERGETENDVIRDIFLKNRTMSMVKDFEREGFHVMKAARSYYLILASNFEYSQDLDKLNIGPGSLDFGEKEALANDFLAYLREVRPEASEGVRTVFGEPPLGEGHARVISIGLSIPAVDFELVCRCLRTFLDKKKPCTPEDRAEAIPEGAFEPLWEVDSFFAAHPDFTISRQPGESPGSGDYVLGFGECSFGEFDGVVYGKEDYENLTRAVQSFEACLKTRGEEPRSVRPWQFEVDPYRRHSVIASVGIRFEREELRAVLDGLKAFLEGGGRAR
jgi:hypothetical protein